MTTEGVVVLLCVTWAAVCALTFHGAVREADFFVASALLFGGASVVELLAGDTAMAVVHATSAVVYLWLWWDDDDRRRRRWKKWKNRVGSRLSKPFTRPVVSPV